MKLSVIITTYNSGKYIVSCIDSLLIALNNFIDYEIIIIDNDSHDQTISLLDKFNNKKIKIINLQFNRGYSQAVNTAISESRLGKILILNPDTVLKSNTVTNLYKILETPKVGLVGGKLLNSDGSFQISSRRHFPTLGIFFSYLFRLNIIFPKNTFFGKYNYTYIDNDLQIEVDAVSGACMMFSKFTFNSIGGFDERFFIYFEDTDFCFKVQNKGYKVLYCPNAEILHHNNYSDNYYAKKFYFYESLEKFIYKYKDKIYWSLLVYYLAKLMKYVFYLKRRFMAII